MDLPYEPELESKWARLVETDPHRVVGVFDLHPECQGVENRWGDIARVKNLTYVQLLSTYICLAGL